MNQRQNAEHQMHCLLAVSFIHACLRLAFYVLERTTYVIFGPFQQINKSRPQADLSETNRKQTVHLALWVFLDLSAYLHDCDWIKSISLVTVFVLGKFFQIV